MLMKLMPKLAAGLTMLAIFTIGVDVANEASAANKTASKKTPAKPQLKRAAPLLDTTQVPGTRPRQVYKLGQPLTGGISMDVPRTPEAVAKYLARMRQIIQSYNRVAVAALFRGNSKDPSLDSLGEVQGHTVNMIRQIRAIVPPAEMKNEHNDLASTLYYFGKLAENPQGMMGSGMEGFTQLYPMLGRLSSTLTNYHKGVRRVIAFYKLNPNLDPFAGEDEEVKQRLSGTVDSMTGNLRSGSVGGFGSQAGAPCDDCTEALQQLMGVMGGGNMSSLGNMDMGSLSGQLGNVDMSQLNKLMGELGGGAGSSHPEQGMTDSINNLNQLLEQLQGQH